MDQSPGIDRPLPVQVFRAQRRRRRHSRCFLNFPPDPAQKEPAAEVAEELHDSRSGYYWPIIDIFLLLLLPSVVRSLFFPFRKWREKSRQVRVS